MITESCIREMLGRKPRRQRLADLSRPPLERVSGGWRLTLPFEESFLPAFRGALPAAAHGGFAAGPGSSCSLLLTAGAEGAARWVEACAGFVGLRDCLPLSFALDYDRVDGDPEERSTWVGDLRRLGKDYKRRKQPDAYAVEELAKACLRFLAAMPAYHAVDAVAAVPPSRPGKRNDLAAHVAAELARRWGRQDLTPAIQTLRRRKSIKELPLASKLDAIRETVGVDAGAVQGRRMLLIDDLYQSGVTMNYVAMLLQQAGARSVFGLACEKTCRNDDNVSGTHRRSRRWTIGSLFSAFSRRRG